MRRNWDTIRTVLLACEEGFVGPGGRFADDTHSAHFCMLQDGGFVRWTQEGPYLRHAGCDLLDAIRDDRVWECCRNAIALNGGGLPTDVLLAVAKRAIELLPRSA